MSDSTTTSLPLTRPILNAAELAETAAQHESTLEQKRLSATIIEQRKKNSVFQALSAELSEVHAEKVKKRIQAEMAKCQQQLLDKLKLKQLNSEKLAKSTVEVTDDQRLAVINELLQKTAAQEEEAERKRMIQDLIKQKREQVSLMKRELKAKATELEQKVESAKIIAHRRSDSQVAALNAALNQDNISKLRSVIGQSKQEQEKQMEEKLKTKKSVHHKEI